MKEKKIIDRLHRKIRIRKKIRGTSKKPRLTVFRSLKHIYAQIINDETNNVLVSASSLSSEFKDKKVKGGNKEGAKFVGELIAEAANNKGIRKVVFDRNGYFYHGRIKVLADAAREKGLKF